MNTKLSSCLGALLLALPLFACSANEEEASESDDAAVTGASEACGSAKYNAAFGFYKKAVDGANLRARSEYCSWGENAAYKTEIAYNAEKAVNTCNAFKNVIKTSQYAGNVRKALEETLTYRIVTGDVDPATWMDVSKALVGVTLHGGLGHSDVWSLSLKADGQGSLGTHGIDAEGNDKYEDKPIRWSVAQESGQPLVKIVGQPRSGAAITYDFLLTRQVDGDRAQYFIELQGESNDAFEIRTRFSDVEGECGG